MKHRASEGSGHHLRRMRERQLVFEETCPGVAANLDFPREPQNEVNQYFVAQFII